MEFLLELGFLYIFRYYLVKEFLFISNGLDIFFSVLSFFFYLVFIVNIIIFFSVVRRFGFRVVFIVFIVIVFVFFCRGSVRYDFFYEIFRDEEFFFGERRVFRGRRIFVICRFFFEGMGLGGPG